uniref:Uncharacterized protein LOC114336683 n=1 Tax=Diabrotica virgifera virgifera TaxID=50390 RepID=A0A6P7G792_DIAVI
MEATSSTPCSPGSADSTFTSVKQESGSNPSSPLEAPSPGSVTVSANILLISVGSMMVWPSSVIPKLFLKDTELNPFGRPITTMENSILLSTCSFISIFGLIALVKLADFFGRKIIIRTIGILYLKLEGRALWKFKVFFKGIKINYYF